MKIGKRSHAGRVYQRLAEPSLPENAGLAPGPKKVLPSSTSVVFGLTVSHHMKPWPAEERFPFDTKNSMRRLYLKIFTDHPNVFSDFGSTSLNGFRLWALFFIASIGSIAGCSSAISMREALRDSMRSLGEALSEEERNQQPGQGAQESDRRADNRDPLGRSQGSKGASGSYNEADLDNDAYGRARELLDEIRRRSGEAARPEVERDYLNRLLDRF